MEVLSQDESGLYSCTPLGTQFTSDALGPAARLFASEPEWRAWIRFTDSVRTGLRGFDLEHGMPNWDFYAAQPELGGIFDAGMRALTSQSAPAIVAAHDFSPYKTVADVGGGDGTLLIAILDAHPRLRGILYDRPGVIARATARLADAQVSDRCSAVAGDFLEEVPRGADAYLMKWILHDWEDRQAERILTNCRRAMEAGTELLVIERVMPEHASGGALEMVMADLQMMVMNGGVERTESQFRKLFAACDYQLKEITATGTPLSILRAVAD